MPGFGGTLNTGTARSGSDRAARKPWWYAVASVASFWACLLVSYALRPTNWSQQGISHFGNFSQSIVPYSAGLLLSAMFMALEADALHSYRGSKFVAYRGLLRAIAALLVTLLLIPSWKFGVMVGWLHRTISAGIFMGQLLLGVYLCVTTLRSRLIAALFAVQFVGTFLVLLSVFDIVPLMFVSQIVTELAFGLLLIAGTARIGATLTRTGDVARLAEMDTADAAGFKAIRKANFAR